jgi:hypothetical protein
VRHSAVLEVVVVGSFLLAQWRLLVELEDQELVLVVVEELGVLAALLAGLDRLALGFLEAEEVVLGLEAEQQEMGELAALLVVAVVVAVPPTTAEHLAETAVLAALDQQH